MNSPSQALTFNTAGFFPNLNKLLLLEQSGGISDSLHIGMTLKTTAGRHSIKSEHMMLHFFVSMAGSEDDLEHRLVQLDIQNGGIQDLWLDLPTLEPEDRRLIEFLSSLLILGIEQKMF